MPIYPPAGPTVSGVTVSDLQAFMKQPTLVARRVNELAAQKFLTDFLFPTKVQLTGGAVIYEIAAGVYLSRDPEVVTPGARYPLAKPTEGAMAIARALKVGQEVPLTDEAVTRSGRREIDRVLGQVGVTNRRYVDGTTTTAVNAAITKQIAGTAALTGAGAAAFLDVERAAESIDAEEMGYEADTVLVAAALYPYLLASLLPGMSNGDKETIYRTGTLPELNGRVYAPAKLAAGVDAVVLDRRVFGFLAYEVIESPEWVGDPATDIQTRTRRAEDGSDQWLVGGRRPVVPVIDNPNAAREITGWSA